MATVFKARNTLHVRKADRFPKSINMVTYLNGKKERNDLLKENLNLDEFFHVLIKDLHIFNMLFIQRTLKRC